MNRKDVCGSSGLPRPFRLVEVRRENRSVCSFFFDQEMPARPGQFVMAWLPGLSEKPFSLAGASPVRLTVAAVGAFSQAVHALRPGDRLWLRGPLGRGFTLPPEGSRQKLVLVGGGYGTAPLLFLARQAQAAGHTVEVVIGAKTGADLLLGEEFEQMGISPHLTTEDGSAGRAGVVTAVLVDLLAAADSPPAVYACGPTGMLAAVDEVCRQAGAAVQLAWEAYMRCGIGLCGSCEVGEGWLVCLDGPVFGQNPVLNPPG
ncbi:MAG: dihydroorotate dehydrogenase electron transfer subunit [Chloroflexi bacterium]|nr:MAG: dihydroorotate dehydrogenase electron transfer subunit [Chloroflexota bacterium]